MGSISRRMSVIPASDTSFPGSVSLMGHIPRSPFVSTYNGSTRPSSQFLSYTEEALPLSPLLDPAEFGVAAQPEPYSPRATSMRSPEERERIVGPRSSSHFSTLPVPLGGAKRATGDSGVPRSSPPPVYSSVAGFDTEDENVQLGCEDEEERHHREDVEVLSNESMWLSHFALRMLTPDSK